MNITEEVEDSATTPVQAAVISTVVLLITYVCVATAVVAFAGLSTAEGYARDDAILSAIATDVLGSPLDKLVVLAVLTSALASTQTTILPASRISLSMASRGRPGGLRTGAPALPDAARGHDRHRRARDRLLRVTEHPLRDFSLRHHICLELMVAFYY